MKLVRVSRKIGINDLVNSIEHSMLRRACDAQDFRGELLVIIRNCDRLDEFLAASAPDGLEAERIAKRIRAQALHLKEFCAKLLSTTDDGNWKESATKVKREYEKLREDAGIFYRAVVPSARFGVLGVAL